MLRSRWRTCLRMRLLLQQAQPPGQPAVACWTTTTTRRATTTSRWAIALPACLWYMCQPAESWGLNLAARLVQVGEMMGERYEVFATHGKGVFSTVLRARDLKPTDEAGRPVAVEGGLLPEVAIKVIRANDLMSKAGQTEVVILRKLAGADPTNKYHTIRLLTTFTYRNHLCLVFEPLVRPPSFL